MHIKPTIQIYQEYKIIEKGSDDTLNFFQRTQGPLNQPTIRASYL